jgi:cysteine-rich repeat protein
MKKRIYSIIITTLSIVPMTIFSQSLTFDQNLFIGSNVGMQNTYSNIYFQYGWNNQPGVIFWKGTQTLTTPRTITLPGQTITWCTKQVLGAYYNPARGNRLRPLDTSTHNVFLGINPIDYGQLNTLSANKWLFTNCQGNPHAVYGHVEHIRNGTVFHLIAWVEINTINNTYINNFDTSLTLNTTSLTATGYIFDPLGWVAIINTPPVCGNGIIQWTEQCDDGNTTSGDGCSATCQTETNRQCTGQPSVCTQTQTPPPPNPNNQSTFNARFQFPSLYTNTPQVNGLIYINEPAGYLIQWDTQGTFASTLSSQSNINITLSPTPWLKTINTTFTSLLSGIVKTGTAQITLDLTDPTLTVNSPTSGSTQSGSVQFSRNAQDANGIQHTTIQIFQGNSLVYSTTTQNNSINVNTLANGTYTAHITTYDNAGNSTTQIITFTVNNSTIPSNRSIVPFTDVTGANLNTIYMSNPIIIAGLATGQNVTGVLDLCYSCSGWIVRNSLDVGTSAVFQNGDVLRVWLRSASTYNTLSIMWLNINNSTVDFRVTTKTQESDPSPEQNFCLSQNAYALIFLSIREAYDDETKFRQVLQLMLTMINTMITTSANQWSDPSMYALQCFADIVQNYLNTTPDNTTDLTDQVHTAPNGKKYIIRTTTNPAWFTSPDFKYNKVFNTYQNIINHIDANNPGNAWSSNNHIVDPSFSPVIFTAPNGKRYTIIKTNKGFTSPQFIRPAYRPTQQELEAHIRRHNPK